jgi:hypothetical protein
MMGKSRLLKEIAISIPTVYIRLRDPELELETSSFPQLRKRDRKDPGRTA